MGRPMLLTVRFLERAGCCPPRRTTPYRVLCEVGKLNERQRRPVLTKVVQIYAGCWVRLSRRRCAQSHLLHAAPPLHPPTHSPAASGASSCLWSWATLTTTGASWGPSPPHLR